MKWRRVIEYEGNPEWVKRTVEKSIHGTMDTSGKTVPRHSFDTPGNTITEISSQEIKDDAPSTDEAVTYVQPGLSGEGG